MLTRFKFANIGPVAKVKRFVNSEVFVLKCPAL